jgi:type IV pilus assembly protein PilX
VKVNHSYGAKGFALQAPKQASKQAPKQAPKQQGFALIIALIVLAAMTLAGVGLMRSIDSSTLLARNISFSRDAQNRAEIGVSRAIASFKGTGNFAPAGNIVNTSTTADVTTLNYSAVLLASNSQGIPNVMLNTSSFDSAYPDVIVPTEEGMKVRYLIERMCGTAGQATEDKCVISDGGRRGSIADSGTNRRGGRRGATGATAQQNLEDIPPVWRVTVRVDGPRNVLHFSQAHFTQSLEF